MSVYKNVPGNETVNISTLEFDETPTPGSLNPVTSGGVAGSIAQQSSNFAPNYTKKTYEANSYVMQDGALYTNPNAIETAEDWNPAHWTQTTVAEMMAAAIEDVRENYTAYSESFKSSMTPDKGIATNGGVGSVVSYTEISQSSCSCLVLDCSRGDIFKIKGHGYSAYRLWCFVDTSDKIVEVASPGVSTNEEFIYKVAPVDGKVIVNFNTYFSYDLFKGMSTEEKFEDQKDYIDEKDGELSARDVEINDSIIKMSSAYSESMNSSMTFNYYIKTNGGVGSVVDYTPVSLGGAYYIVVPCNKGDVFKIKGAGGSAPRLWCFVDSSDKIVEVAAASTSSPSVYIYKTAPVNGKLICDFVTNTGRDLRQRVELATSIDSMKDGINEINNREPMVNLEIDREKFDPTSLLSGFDFTDHVNYTQSIYTLFDALVSSSNGLVTSFDIAEYADETYPAYVGDETLKCYKVSKNEAKWGNSGHFVKKKILIIGGTHGNEKAAPFNCYILAWRLLNDVAYKDVFSLLDAFDFYIVPCLNLYGLANNFRYNGNGVDLNRNSNYPGWSVSGTPFNGTYTGPSADSEYETRCIHAIVEGEDIDFLIDHHNSASNGQFYTETRNKGIFLKSYDALKEVSLFCVKNWPEYFGDKFQLVKPGSYGSASPEGISSTPGTFEQWAYLKNIYSMTLEINQGIGYDDGVPDESYTGRDAFGATTFSVGEFTLRCQLVLYGQLLMPQVY